VAFDLQRALVEGMTSRIPFLDRLLSYCYFAEMSVLEVASSDATGRGVSLVGRVGAEGPEEVVLVSPLPFQAARRGALDDRLEQRRALRLLAATWALASRRGDSDRAPPGLGLIAVHPDPGGDSLASLTRERDLLRPWRLVLLDDSPDPTLRPVTLDGLLVHLSAPLPVQPLPRPLRDIQVWRWQGGAGLFRALEETFALHRHGRIVPLLLHPCSGPLLEEPLAAEMTVGLLDARTVPPPEWQHVDSPLRVSTQGSWGDRIRAFDECFSILAEAVQQAWGGHIPDGAVRVAGIGTPDPVGIDLVLWVPGGCLDGALAALERRSCREGADLQVTQVRRSGVGRGAVAAQTGFPPAMSLCVPEGIPLEVLGCRREAIDDPVQEAVAVAEDLRGLLGRLSGTAGRHS